MHLSTSFAGWLNDFIYVNVRKQETPLQPENVSTFFIRIESDFVRVLKHLEL